MSDYLAIGYSAEKMVDKFGTKIATINTETLKVREAKNTDCAVLTLVSGEESFEVIREDKDWVRLWSMVIPKDLFPKNMLISP